MDLAAALRTRVDNRRLQVSRKPAEAPTIASRAQVIHTTVNQLQGFCRAYILPETAYSLEEITALIQEHYQSPEASEPCQVLEALEVLQLIESTPSQKIWYKAGSTPF
jgi:hypothetical protein